MELDATTCETTWLKGRRAITLPRKWPMQVEWWLLLLLVQFQVSQWQEYSPEWLASSTGCTQRRANGIRTYLVHVTGPNVRVFVRWDELLADQ